jgi:hypothetical protein
MAMVLSEEDRLAAESTREPIVEVQAVETPASTAAMDASR